MGRIIKGCWQLSSGHGVGKTGEEAVKELLAFYDAGITTFDGADIYTGVEELFGRFRAECARQRGAEAVSRLRFHTKFVPDLDRLSTINPQYVEWIIKRSLSSIGVECLDLVQFHWWDFDIPGYVETALLLQALQRAGKIQHLGVTNFDATHLREIAEAGVTIVANQVQYSALDTRPEQTLQTFCEKEGIKLLCYGVVAGGFLSEEYLGRPEPREMQNRSLIKYKLVIDDFGGWYALQMLLLALAKIARKHNATVSEVAVAFVLRQRAVAGVILGASARRIASILHAAALTLDDGDLHVIRSAIETTPGLPGDVYELERAKGGKHAAIMRYNLNAQ